MAIGHNNSNKNYVDDANRAAVSLAGKASFKKSTAQDVSVSMSFSFSASIPKELLEKALELLLQIAIQKASGYAVQRISSRGG